MSSGRDARADAASVIGTTSARARDGDPAAAAVRVALAAARGIRAPLVLLDGPSGAGKSTLADALRANWPGATPVLVRLDDAYPGWHGLERAGDELARTLVHRRRRGATGGWRRWDWAGDRPGALECVRPGRALIIEGCGAFAAGALAPDAVRIWIDAPDAVRRRRALDRDDGAYDPYWDVWESQWRRYVRRTAPERRAGVRLRAAPDGRVEPEPVAGAAPVHAPIARANVVP
jgi:hypothetical protein